MGSCVPRSSSKSVSTSSQVMINVLECSLSRSPPPFRPFHGTLRALSSGRNVLRILAQPSNSPLLHTLFLNINHWFKIYKNLSFLHIFFQTILILLILFFRTTTYKLIQPHLSTKIYIALCFWMSIGFFSQEFKS